jgi:hypothetical protein
MNTRSTTISKAKTPDIRGSIEEITLQNPEEITVSVEESTITFKTEGKTASFVLLKNARSAQPGRM